MVDRFRLLGRAMAKALQDSRLLDIPLSYTFYRSGPAFQAVSHPFCTLAVMRHLQSQTIQPCMFSKEGIAHQLLLEYSSEQ